MPCLADLRHERCLFRRIGADTLARCRTAPDPKAGDPGRSADCRKLTSDARHVARCIDGTQIKGPLSVALAR
jgi:hypothetical protein